MHNLRLFGYLLSVLALAPLAAASDKVPADNERVENRGAGQERWWDELPLPEWQAFPQVDVGSDWFEVYRLEDNLFAIYEPGQFELVISYLIVGSERALLFDTGLGIANIRAVVDQLTDREVIVLNSHSHYDHIGGNYQFDHILGLDNAYTKQNASGSSPADIAEFIGPGWVWKAFPAGFDPSTWRSRPYQLSQLVEDGDRIDLGGRVLEVLETPGHAPDALCLLDRDHRLLFTGDSFYLAPLYAHLPGSDVAAYTATAERLASLVPEVDRLVTMHNVPYASADHLAAMRDAFVLIGTGKGNYVLTDGNREYDFGDFSVIVPDALPDPATTETD
jgi:glyoxylase-like metal-dependent hydrolase (beta-lactamase superfamily II)